MKRILTSLVALVMMCGLALASSPRAEASYCGLVWGSLPKAQAGATASPMTNVRAGRHACFDRLVIDVSAGVAGYSVRYAASVNQPGSGAVVPLAGGADVEIIVNAATYDGAGNTVYAPTNPDQAVNVAGYQTFRQVALAGSFEGQTTIGLGVRARLPLRVFILNGPGAGSRVVIDVAHRW